MKFRAIILALLLCGLSLSVFALDLQQARQSGQVGEQNNGYVQAMQPNAAVSALVAEVNAGRKAEYARIAATQGQSVEIVAKLAAGQIVNNLAKGSKYQDASGNWQTR